jgi:hypothetical protein
LLADAQASTPIMKARIWQAIVFISNSPYLKSTILLLDVKLSATILQK